MLEALSRRLLTRPLGGPATRSPAHPAGASPAAPPVSEPGGPAGETGETGWQSAPQRFFAQAQRLGRKTALRHKRYGLWQSISWQEYAEQVRRVAFGLLALGLEPGEPVGLIGENRPEWVFCDLGILAAGGVPVGIYTTSSPEQCHYVLDHCGARLWILEGEEQLDKALEIRSRLPRLRKVILIDRKGLRSFEDPGVMDLEDLCLEGDRLAERAPDLVDRRTAALRPADLALLIYTSGTTGPPKGAMLSHRNLLWTARAIGGIHPIGPEDEVLSFLPLSHIAERMISVYLAIEWGYCVNFTENVDTVTENLREVAPTILFAVPRIWEKLHSAVQLRVEELDPFKRLACRTAIAAGRRRAALRLEPDRFQERGIAGRLEALAVRSVYPLFHAAVLHPLKRRLGLHRARLVLSGAAPIAPEVLWYFHSLGVPIREIYGQTEGCGPTTVHIRDRIRLGTVGQPIPGVEVRLAEDGEILVRGPNVFLGYFKDPEATSQALAGGWLHSGDVGVIDGEGFLRITDRKKDLVITAGGKNVAPQSVENQLKSSPYVNDAVVIGDRRPYLVALIVIDEENVSHWAHKRRIPFTTYADLSQNPEVYKLIAGEVAAVNRRLSSPEQVKRFAILPKRLHHEDGEVTPTLKVKRKALTAKYADLVENLYAGR